MLFPSPNGGIFQVCSGPCPALSGFQAHPQAAEQRWPGAPGKLERVSPPHPLIPITASLHSPQATFVFPPLDETLFPASIPRRTPVGPRDPPGGMVTGKPEQRPTGGGKESSTTGGQITQDAYGMYGGEFMKPFPTHRHILVWQLRSKVRVIN